MAKIDIEGEANLTVQKRNQTEGEGEKKTVVGVSHYVITLQGGGDRVTGRVTPESLRDAFSDVVEDEVRQRLETYRADVESILKDTTVAVTDARSSFGERSRAAFSRLGLGRISKEKPVEGGD